MRVLPLWKGHVLCVNRNALTAPSTIALAHLSTGRVGDPEGLGVLAKLCNIRFLACSPSLSLAAKKLFQGVLREFLT